MKLREAFYLTNDYWVTPKGKIINLHSSTHEYYLMDKGMSYPYYKELARKIR
jgi:hypothetical protein